MPVTKNTDANELLPIDGLKQGVNELIGLISKSIASIQDFGKESKKITDNLDFSKSADILEMNKRVKEAQAQANKYASELKKLNEVKKVQKEIDDEAIKQSIRAKKEAKERQQSIQNEIALSKTEIKTNKDRADVIKALRSELDNLDDSTEEGAKRQAELNKRLEDQIKIQEEQRLQAAQVKRNLKEQAQEELNLLDAYQLKSKRLNELRKQYKSYVAEGKGAEKETKELRKEVVALDKELKDIDADVGQFQRNVGNYSDAVEGLGGAMAGVADQTGRTGEVLSTFSAALRSPLAGIAASIAAVGAAMNSTAEGEEKIGKVTSTLTGTFNALREAVGETYNEFAEVSTISDFFDAYGNYIDRTLNLGDRIGELSDKQEDARKLQKEATITTREQEIALSRLNAIYELLTITSGDATISLDKQREASVEAADVAVQIAEEQKNIIQLRKDAIDLEIAAAGNISETNALYDQQKDLIIQLQDADTQLQVSRANLAKEQRQIDQDIFEQKLDYELDITDRIKTANERRLADERITAEYRQKLLQETIKLTDDSFDRAISLFEKQAGRKIDLNKLVEADNADVLFEEIRGYGLSEIYNNRLLEVIRERITFTQDLADAQKDLNDVTIQDEETAERIEQQTIALRLYNEQKVKQAFIEERLNYAQQSVEIESLTKQISELTEGSSKRLELEEQLNDLLIERSKSNFNEDEIEQQKEINGLLEIEQKIKNGTLTTQKEIEEAKTELQDRLRTESLQAELDAINKEIEFRKEANQSTAQLERRKNEIIIEQTKERLTVEEDSTEHSLKKIGELYNKYGGLITDTMTAYSQKRIDVIDQEIQATQNNINRIQNAINEGAQGATESLAEEERRQAELRQEREREQKRQQAIELVSTGLKTYAAKLEAGDPNALQSTITDTVVLKAALQSLAQFSEGAERVGDKIGGTKAPFSKGRDTHLAWVRPDERIFGIDHSAELNKLGNYTNSDIINIVRAYKQSNKPVVINSGNSELVNETRQVNKSIKGLYSKFGSGVDIDATSKIANIVTTDSNNRKSRKEKINKSWI